MTLSFSLDLSADFELLASHQMLNGSVHDRKKQKQYHQPSNMNHKPTTSKIQDPRTKNQIPNTTNFKP